MNPRIPTGHLTAGEHALLIHVARGATIATAARAIGITQAAAMSRLERARHRMHATTTTHLVTLAIAARQIPAGIAVGTEVLL